MAALFFDSFDHYATAQITQKWTSTIGSVAISAGNGRNSTQSLRLTDLYAQQAVIGVGASGATCIVGFGLNISNYAQSRALIEIKDAGNSQFYFLVSTGGEVIAVRNGTTIGTSTSCISTGVYVYLEFKVVISDTVGTVTVKANGTTVLALTGQDTKTTANEAWGSITLGGQGYAGSITADYDDFYILDGSGGVDDDFLGPIRVKAIYPDAAGNYAQMTPLSGTNFSNVNQTLTDGDTTYNSETTVGEKDTYNFGALGVTGTVKAIQHNLMVRSNGAGSETIRPVTRIAATDYTGTTVGLSTSYTDKREIVRVSPATAAAWTVAEIDGAEFGVELVS